MPELTPEQRIAIIKRRGCRSEKTKRRFPISELVIHHKNRNPLDNRPENLRVLTKREHEELHKRAKR